MPKFIDMTGWRFGRLFVIEEAGRNKHGRVIWKCICDCGNEKIVEGQSLRTGFTRSCGCYARETEAMRATKHGMCNERLYGILHSMTGRCYNKNNAAYNYYGGRGIKVCDEWLGENGFQNFYNWAMTNGYDENLSIDRINNDGPYAPWNCRWATAGEQSRNKRNNRWIEYNGECHIMKDWSDILGINYKMMSEKFRKGYTIDEIIEWNRRMEAKRENNPL